MSSGTVVVFCRLPVAGQVKTRLAAGIGHSVAAQLYQGCSEQILKSIAGAEDIVLMVTCSNRHELPAVQSWITQLVQTDLRFESQPEGEDLGGRMHWALSLALQSASKALVIGTDIPNLTSEVLHDALQLLSTYEIVLGPAHDGGFYLIGASRTHPDLLKGITWSAATTRAETVAQAESLGLTVCADRLPPLHDIDTIQDLQAWCQHAAECGDTASKLYHEASIALKEHHSRGQHVQHDCA